MADGTGNRSRNQTGDGAGNGTGNGIRKPLQPGPGPYENRPTGTGSRRLTGQEADGRRDGNQMPDGTRNQMLDGTRNQPASQQDRRQTADEMGTRRPTGPGTDPGPDGGRGEEPIAVGAGATRDASKTGAGPAIGGVISSCGRADNGPPIGEKIGWKPITLRKWRAFLLFPAANPFNAA